MEQKQTSTFHYYDIVMTLFVSILLISNIASSAKLVDWGVSIGPLRLAFDAGTLLFPFSYIFGDVLTEVYGYRHSRRVIWFGFGAAALMSLTLWVVGKMPGDPVWQAYAGQDAYDAILGGVSHGGIIIASLVAYLVGEFSNSLTLAKMKIWTGGRYLWSRTIGSTLVGQALDSAIFIMVATVFGVFPREIALTLIVSNYIFKVAIEMLFTPLTYTIVKRLKQTEHVDHYDYETNFNPFHLGAA